MCVKEQQIVGIHKQTTATCVDAVSNVTLCVGVCVCE